MALTLILLILPLLCLSSIVIWSIRNGISPTPSTRKQTEIILRAIPGDLKGPIYELGSGWGTLAIALARQFPACEVHGIENSPIPYFVSKILHLFHNLPNLTFKRANFMTVSIDDAALVVCYLFPGGMRKLKPQLQRLLPGTLVVSNTFSIQEWDPIQTFHAQDLYRSPVYVYRIGA